jgi:hypothetical protein
MCCFFSHWYFYPNVKWQFGTVNRNILLWFYRVIKRLDSILYVVCRFGEEPVPAAGGAAWTANGASTHGRRLPYFKFSARSTGWLAWATANTLFNSSHVPLWHTQSAGALPLHKQPVYSNWWFQRQMLFLVGGRTLKRRRNARCTAVANSVLMTSRKKKYCAT